MDTDSRRLIQKLKASGQLEEVILELVESLRLKGLQYIQVKTSTLICGWRNKQVKRALTLRQNQLKKFKFIATNSHCDYPLEIIEIEIIKKSIVFRAEAELIHEMSYDSISLVDDHNYNFGRQRVIDGPKHLYPGNIFDETFVLKEE